MAAAATGVGTKTAGAMAHKPNTFRHRFFAPITPLCFLFATSKQAAFYSWAAWQVRRSHRNESCDPLQYVLTTTRLTELLKQRQEVEEKLRLEPGDKPNKDQTKRHRFPAKRYGWVWGPPTTWQGWLVIVIWLAVLMPITLSLAARNQAVPLLVFVEVMIAVLTVIGYIKGEPPRWRRGGK